MDGLRIQYDAAAVDQTRTGLKAGDETDGDALLRTLSLLGESFGACCVLETEAAADQCARGVDGDDGGGSAEPHRVSECGKAGAASNGGVDCCAARDVCGVDRAVGCVGRAALQERKETCADLVIIDSPAEELAKANAASAMLSAKFAQCARDVQREASETRNMALLGVLSAQRARLRAS